MVRRGWRMSRVDYNSRQFLNPSSSHYTGTLVCFDGVEIINQGKELPRYTFIELSDCHGKVRLHKDNNLLMRDFVLKLRLMAREINEFANYLENTE